MKIIVGLGNPDKQYENTFHNLGFTCVDKVAENLGVSINKSKFHALICETKIGNEKVLLVKPQTYMNLSGESVREIVSFYKIDLKDLLVIYDDFDLFKGSVRIRESGSSGTHNGMRNIVKEIASDKFPRIRVGFKPKEESRIPLIDLVLSGIKGEDKPIFENAVKIVSNAVEDFIKGDTIQVVMQRYNVTI